MNDNTTSLHPFAALTDAWMQMTETAVKSATAVNRAALTPMEDGDAVAADETASDAEVQRNADVRPSTVPSVAFEDADWEFERSVDDADEIAVGDTVTFSKTITAEDVEQFALVSGDTNRLHLDAEFADESRFGGQIAHGTLVSGLISAALARLPGLTVYLSQDLEFRRPVELGDRVRAVVEVVEDLGDNQFRLSTEITDTDGETTIIAGEAVVLIDAAPEE
jgi:acyl dehydratase